MINHTLIARVCVVDTHASAGLDRSFDYCSRLVHNVTRPVENIGARLIRAVLANNESFEGLITCRRAILGRCDDLTSYRYCFCRSCGFSFRRRTRLRERQLRNQCAAGEGDNCFLHGTSLLMFVDVNY